ncbi:TPA: hypothetical protein PIL23_002333, partial [Staphylococcus aureus]|nr:hypothetical protein [Staphylococcus aureus]
MAIIDNTLAAQIPTFDPATPLAQAAKIQGMQAEAQAAEYKQKQMELGSEVRGLQPYVNTPEFPAKWAETADRLHQRGLLDDRAHQQWRNTPSPLLLKSMIAQTEDPTLSFRKQEAQREQGNADRDFGLKQRTLEATISGSKVPANFQRAPDGSVVPIKGGPADPAYLKQAADAKGEGKNPFSQSLLKSDAERVAGYSDSAKLASEGIATLDNVDALRKQAFTAPVIGGIASKVGHPATQALEAATNSLSLDVAQKVKGSLSDKDIAFVKSQVPTVAMGGAAGEATSQMLRGAFERTKQRADFYRQWAEQNGNINGADAAWNKFADENPITIPDKKALGGRRFNPDFNKDYSPYMKGAKKAASVNAPAGAIAA